MLYKSSSVRDTLVATIMIYNIAIASTMELGHTATLLIIHYLIFSCTPFSISQDNHGEN